MKWIIDDKLRNSFAVSDIIIRNFKFQHIDNKMFRAQAQRARCKKLRVKQPYSSKAQTVNWSIPYFPRYDATQNVSEPISCGQVFIWSDRVIRKLGTTPDTDDRMQALFGFPNYFTKITIVMKVTSSGSLMHDDHLPRAAIGMYIHAIVMRER